MLILAVLLNVWGQLHTLFRRYIRPGISCYRRRGRFNEFIESDTDKAWIKFTSAISISLRPKAAREISELYLISLAHTCFIFFSFTCNFEVLRHFFKSKKKEKNGRVGLVVVKGKPRELGVSTDFGIKFQQDDSHEDRASRRSPNRYSIRRTRFSLQISLFTVSRLVIVRAEHLYPRLWIKSRGNG